MAKEQKEETPSTSGDGATTKPAKPAAKKKTPEELAKLPKWQQVRIEFAGLPDQRQLEARIQRAKDRLKVHLRRSRNWTFPTLDATGQPIDAAAEMRRLMTVARDALEQAEAWNKVIPNDWKPTKAPATGGAVKTIAPGSTVKLKGSAAKAEPEYALGTVTFIETYGDAKHPRARCVAPDGVKFACAFRDLSLA